MEEEDVHRQVQLQVGWIVLFAVQNKNPLGRLAQRIGCTVYCESHAEDGRGPVLRRRVIIFCSCLAASIITETREQFRQLRVMEKTGVDGHRFLVAVGKREALGAGQVKLHLRPETEFEHYRRVFGRFVGGCANGDDVSHQLFGDLPAFLAGFARACLAGEDVDDDLPLQG